MLTPRQQVYTIGLYIVFAPLAAVLIVASGPLGGMCFSYI